MPIRYPNGKPYVPSAKNQLASQKQKSYSNRGMTLEEDINQSNTYYLSTGKAVIHKKPTPVQIVNVDYPKRSAAVIKEAYFKQASTTDYNGVYNGRYIDFEAKETRNKTSFPLSNFHEHQITHMQQIHEQNGICFVLLRFSITDQVYYLDASHLFTYWNTMKDGGRKSIKKEDIEKQGILIPYTFQPRIDYIKIIDRMYFN
ncbi:Holliday junction resolvase RecU [Guptibacillus hwajinpoensis]|uniref:Holliday junction resolvase RecU n=1 Tax=Guptibacillus hwajinpoensis TaxID=208199 RepID=A0A0J6CYL7_9BACL|nr:Holliday junction resolvase RecU [Alkalihalobacillus macyae]KMM38193.1 Holliday junction resolvase [Alkalihalobacillus macyae]MDP4549762.1 Holliday junction resolvase RecU [Alkalihalobacillus macyae]